MELVFRMEQGKRYEDQYGGWLEFFRQAAETPTSVIVRNPPASWVPFLRYLGCTVTDAQKIFAADFFVTGHMLHAQSSGRLRELVECFSTLRPELADALYKSDVEWKTAYRDHEVQREFSVTCNGSFYRPEVLDYLDRLHHVRKPETIKRCVLVPCAADKPYPAPLHKAILEFLPLDTELIIATGVLGLVPQHLWEVMPLYDSGIPNQWRLMNEVAAYFTRNRYDEIYVYCDFYNEAIAKGLAQTVHPDNKTITLFVNPFTDKYLPLHEEEYLSKLREALCP